MKHTYALYRAWLLRDKRSRKTEISHLSGKQRLSITAAFLLTALTSTYQLTTAQRLDLPLKISAFLFSISIPILAFNTYAALFDLRKFKIYITISQRISWLIGVLLTIFGLSALFFHFSWVSGIFFLFSSLFAYKSRSNYHKNYNKEKISRREKYDEYDDFLPELINRFGRIRAINTKSAFRSNPIHQWIFSEGDRVQVYTSAHYPQPTGTVARVYQSVPGFYDVVFDTDHQQHVIAAHNMAPIAVTQNGTSKNGNNGA